MASVEGRAETLASVHSTLRESFLASDIAENHHQIPRSLARVTLAAVLNNERQSNADSNVVRTLIDIIRAEENLANHPTRHQLTGKTTWRSLKDRLKLRRSNQNDWISVPPDPQPDVMDPQMQILGQNSQRDDSFVAEALPAAADDIATREEDDQRRRSIRLSDALAAEREERSRLSRELDAMLEGSVAEAGNSVSVGDVNVGGDEPSQEEPEPIRMSLMDLLEETERQSRIQGSIYRFDDDNEEIGEVRDRNVDQLEKEEKLGASVSEMSCCVCMVRNKGAAFIPCGHTFCRMCSRELWVQRGQCPLCNSFILEVLDIF